MVCTRPLALALLTACLAPAATADVWHYLPDLPVPAPDVKLIHGGTVCFGLPGDSGCTVCIVYGENGDAPVVTPTQTTTGVGVGLPAGSGENGYGPYYGFWLYAGESCKKGIA